MQEKQEVAQQAKIRKHITQSNNRQLEKKIRNQRPLFDKENYFSCKESEDNIISASSSLHRRKQNQNTRKNKNGNKIKHSETSQFSIQTTNDNQDPLCISPCNQKRSEINETNHDSGALINTQNYQLSSENVHHQGRHYRND